jgi:hypothetical protein
MVESWKTPVKRLKHGGIMKNSHENLKHCVIMKNLSSKDWNMLESWETPIKRLKHGGIMKTSHENLKHCVIMKNCHQKMETWWNHEKLIKRLKYWEINTNSH